MQIVTFDLTLTGATQNLETTTVPTAVLDIPFKQVTLQLDKAASNDCFIGARGATLTTTSYGHRLDPTDTGDLGNFTLGPFSQGGVKLGDISVQGTAGEILHIFGIAR